jgi:phosphoglycerate kinase
MTAIQAGFTSVMMDGSLKADGKSPADWGYNVGVTKTVTDMAHLGGISVEGELGVLGSLETGMGDKEDGHGAEGKLSHDQLLTNPDEAVKFVKETKVDALAIAMGTSHGAYKFTRKPDGDILCLENTRFHKEEEKNDPAFVAELAKLGDIWVNDAFSAAHRAHASTEGLGHKLPGYAGRTMQAELDALGKALDAPTKPVIAIIGGAKVSTKIDLLENLVSKVDALVIGGGMANTFLHAQGIGVGKSLAEKDLAATALRIMEKAEAANCAIILPVDAVVAYHFAANSPSHAYGLDAIPAEGMILDVGPQSIARIHAAIDDAATLVWNGPLGAFEMTPFDRGTMVSAKHAAERTKAKKLISVAGGGDTVAALNQAGVAGDFSYVSTAGGAFLEWMEGKPLPGVEVLKLR